MCRTRRGDRGQNLLEVVGLIIVVSAVIVALAGTGALGSVAPEFGAAVCRVLGRTDCAPGKPGEKVGQPAAAPQHTCLLSQQQGGLDGTVEVPLRYFTVRGGVKIGVAMRKIKDAKGRVRYQVQVLEGGELSAQTPAGPKAWLGVAGEKGKIYQFDSSDEASQFVKDLPLKYAREKAYDTAKNTSPVARFGDWLGNKVTDGGLRRTVTGLPDPQMKYYEGGLTGGIEGGTDNIPGLSTLLEDKFKLGLKGKAYRLAGVRHNRGDDPDSPDDDTGTAYLKYNNEGAAEATFDLAPIAKLIRAGASQPAIERAMQTHLGTKLNIPPAIIDYLKKSGGQVSFAVKAKPNTQYELDFNAKGDPTKLRKIQDTTYAFTVKPKTKFSQAETKALQRLNSKLKFADHNKLGKIGADAEIALWGSRTVTTKDLDLTQPGNSDVALRFLNDTIKSKAPLLALGLGPASAFPPEYQELERRFETDGGVSQQHYNLDSFALNLNAESIGGKYKTKGGKNRVGNLAIGGNYEKQKLDGAQYWDRTQNKWVPWAACS